MYIYTYIVITTWNKLKLKVSELITFAAAPLVSVFRIVCLFLRPRPWQFI